MGGNGKCDCEELGEAWRQMAAQLRTGHADRETGPLPGVLLVLLVCVILLSFRNKLPPAVAGYLPTFEGASLWLAVLGWGIVAAGAFSILADAADLFASVGGSPYSKESVLLNIGFGAVAAASCGLIHKATKIFQEGKKG